MTSGPKKRVLLCSDYLPPSGGGVEQVVQKLALHLAERGFDVGIFTLSDGLGKFDLERVPGISLFTASSIDLTGVIGLQSMFSISAPRVFRRVVRDFQPDIVHAHNRFFYTSALAALGSLAMDYELITTIHLGDIDAISGHGGTAAKLFERTIGRRIISRSKHVICVSEAAESTARSLGASRTTVVRNAVDVEEFSPVPKNGKSLLYIGRLVRNNGIHDLLTALPRILETHPDAEVHIVGNGPLEEDIKERVQSAGLSDAVTVHDYVKNISEMYDVASVFCRPSYSEGLPLTMLEAMASGVPPVVTNIAGVPEVVTDHETGILLQPGDISGIKNGVVELFDDRELCKRLGQNAREYVVANLTWERRTERVMSVYDRVLRDARKKY